MGLLEGRVGLVTDAGAGTGRATAIGFAREGARVAVADRDPKGGQETVDRIRKLGGEALFVEADVSREDDVEAMVSGSVEVFGGLHLASNNAAAGAGFGATAEISRKDWDLSLAVSLTGVELCMKHEIPAMLASGGGSIVNIGSTAGIKGEAFLSAYSAAKGGVIALTKTAASEYAERGIRVNCVCPGGVRTPGSQRYVDRSPEVMARSRDAHAMKRFGEPEEIAEAVTWLCSDRASFATGHVLVVDGGSLVKSHLL